ncbi:MAG: DNA mismatch repair endonuclease MutL [Acidobacteria bacterium]|nr:DNA mismatch repair endonuclease MutL [Acidobacteriota bacterium]
MNKIKILSDNLANQIAAGEVVERPASVVKELVENSIDAGARRIQVDVELGGRRLMRVADDGEGMLRDDAILAFERHATSKIKTLEDLAAIQTLGFRGEALASIASVAKVELVTKTAAGTAATRVLIEGGKLVDVRDAARSQGTTISVRDLFFNTPARRKFMRSEATENFHLTSILQHYALANPGISFTLTNNGREVFRLAPARDLRERAYQIFGGLLIESLLPVGGGHEFVAKVSGFVSAPRERRTTRDAQYFFVNRRFVKDRTIAGGLLEGYRSVLPHGVFPVAFLFIEIPLDEIDVNVHPAKTEIRFRRADAVRETIAAAVREALAQAGIVRQPELRLETVETEMLSAAERAEMKEEPLPRQTEIDFHHFEPAAESVPVESPVFHDEPPPAAIEQSVAAATEPVAATAPPAPEFEAEVFSHDFEQQATEKSAVNTTQFTAPPDLLPLEPETSAARNPKSEIRNPNSAIVDSAAKVVKPAEVEDFRASKIRPLGQLHDSFIIAVDDEGMLLVDQHVAHERILFDKYRKRETDRRIESQNLLLPEIFDLTPAQSLAFTLIKEDLEALGFGLMRLSGRTVAIKSVPTDLPASQVRNLLAEILDTVDAEKRGAAKATFRDEIAASLACKAAVKINMKLTPEKMQWLIDRLMFTSSPTTCPHGRPVILRLTMKDIERGFHRS